MKICDEVFAHGYVDEIRKDCIIIRNDGGYFGTVPSEVFCYEEDRNGYGTLNEADTPQTDRPCDKCEWHKEYGRCIFEYCHYEYEQAHKDTPQTDIHDLTDCDFCKDRNCKDCEGGKDEPQTDCPWKQGNNYGN